MREDGLRVNRLHPLFGAELIGADLRKTPTAGMVARIEALMDEFAVLVVRNQNLDDEQHIALSRTFGPLELPPDYGTGAPRRLRRELYDASNLGLDGKVLPADSARREYNRANLIFHADSTFNDLPSKWSLLRSHELPSEGGNTEFVDTRAVYDDLPRATRQRIADLKAMHDLWHSHAEGQHFKVTDDMRRRMPPVPQPLVRTLPSGRKALCIGSHATHIDGMPAAEGRKLLDELAAFATQSRYVYSHPWRNGDLVIWDNRTTLHRAAPWQDRGQVRDLRRTSINESGPEIAATDRR
jgi:alpha-ketoglutarate-dependent 2,4-dichlorophenoxyacetate dioxygenase